MNKRIFEFENKYYEVNPKGFYITNPSFLVKLPDNKTVRLFLNNKVEALPDGMPVAGFPFTAKEVVITPIS